MEKQKERTRYDDLFKDCCDEYDQCENAGTMDCEDCERNRDNWDIQDNFVRKE